MKSQATTTTKTKRPNKNDVSFFSQKYFRGNHADILCSGLILICIASMWSRTTQYAVKFFWPTADSNNQYNPCVFDGLMLFFYTIVVISTHSVLKMKLVDRIVKKQKLSWTRTFEINRLIQSVCFETVIAGFVLYIWSYTKDNGLNVTFWETSVIFNIQVKTLLILNLCYWIHWPFELYFDVYSVSACTDVARREESIKVLTMFTINTLLHGYMYLSRRWSMAMLIIATDYLSDALLKLYKTHLADSLRTWSHIARIIGFKLILAAFGYSLWKMSFNVKTYYLKKDKDNLLLFGFVIAVSLIYLVKYVSFLLKWKQIGRSHSVAKQQPIIQQREAINTRSRTKVKKT